MGRKLKVLICLISAKNGFQHLWFQRRLPNGYVSTGVLHDWDCGGSGARTRIDELRKAGIDIHYHCFTHMNKKNGLLADPAKDGIHDDEIIEEYYNRIIDGFGKPIECHAYCLITPVDRIDEATGKLIKESGLFEQSTMEF